MKSNASELIVVSDNRPDSPAALFAALGAPRNRDAALEAWMSPDYQTGEPVSRMDAICAAVADAASAIGLQDGHLVVVPTAHVIQRNYQASPICDATLTDLYDRLWDTSDHVAALMRAVELGDRALHVAGGWVGGRHRAEAMRANPSYATAMAARGYGTARKIAESNQDNAEIQSITRFIPEIMRYFEQIVEIFKALGRGIQSLYKSANTATGHTWHQEGAARRGIIFRS